MPFSEPYTHPYFLNSNQHALMPSILIMRVFEKLKNNSAGKTKDAILHTYSILHTVWTVNDILVDPYPFIAMKKVWINQNKKGMNQPKIRQSKINSRWVAGPIGQMNCWPSIWCSKYYFFRLFIDLGQSKLFTFIFVFF